MSYIKDKVSRILMKLQNIPEEDKMWKDFLKKEVYQNKVFDHFYSSFNKLSKKEKNKLIEKILIKYHSQAYIEREYSLGREPSEDLLFYLFQYAKDLNIKVKVCDFPSESYQLTSKYNISLILNKILVTKCRRN